MSASTNRRRDPRYEAVTGRLASLEQIALRRWIHHRYLSDQEPLPGRFLYYEAVMANVITKHAAQTIGAGGVTLGDRAWKEASIWVREYGLVPDEWIEDTTRDLIDHTGWPSMRSFALDMVRSYRLDPWERHWPLVVVESAASASVLSPLGDEYRVMIAPLRGQASRSFLHNVVAPQMYDRQDVLAVVDLDKVGGDISRSAQARLEARTGYTFDWRVIALTDEQVDRYGIVRVPRTDARDKVERMVAETEALGVDNLRAIVRAALDDLLPQPLVSVRARERAEVEAMERKLKRMRGM